MGEYSIYSSFHFTLIRSLGHKQRTQVPQKVYFERDPVTSKEACLFGSKKTVEKPQYSFSRNVLQKSAQERKLSRKYLFYKKD